SGPEAPAGLRHVFAAGGTFRVRARLTDDEGLVTLAERLVRVTENLPPRASLGLSPEAGPAPLEVRVTGSGTDPEGAVTLYELDVDGDGRFDVVRPTPIDTVLTLEDYTRPVEIALRVTDAGGRTGEERRTVRPLPNVDVEGSSLSQSGSGRLRADGSASRLVSLQVVDPSGKPLPAVEVEVASSRNAGAAGTVDRLSPTRGVTDGLGRFETLFSTTSSSSLLGDAVVGARAGGRELEQTITVQFSSAVSAAASRLSCPLSSVHVEGSTSQPQGARIRATVQDAREQPLAGIHVRLGTRDLGLYRVTPAEGRTDGSGTFEFTVSSDLAGTSTFVDLYADGLKTSAMCTVSFDS
ncbi:MAG: Ig-like domain-containing protein, partial [Gemmatimonadota bacterium]